MKPLQRHEIAHNRHRQRDEATRKTTSSLSIMEYDKWIEGIKSSNDQFGKPSYRSPGAWSSKILPNSKSMQSDCDEEFHWHDDKREELDADRAASLILWKKSPADDGSPHKLHDHENTYPARRTQDIADYRKEMMEMVRGLPEADFELTLQDIVEKRKDFKEAEPAMVKELVSDGNKTKRKKNQKKIVSVARSKSIDTGFLNRMLLPLLVVVRWKSLKLRDIGEKVAMKEVGENKKVIERKKSKEEQWWRKNEFSEKGSSNSSSAGSSSSNDSGISSDDNFSRNMSL
jgi:hypothetical protein